VWFLVEDSTMEALMKKTSLNPPLYTLISEGMELIVLLVPNWHVSQTH
jgi:hypothetical protein